MVPQTSRYAQEARVYAIAGMLLVLATLVLYRLLERPRAGTAVRYGILVALLGTSHILALTGVAGHAVIAGLRWYRERQRRPMLLWLAATAGAAVLLAPLMLAASGQVDSQLGWIYGPLTTGDVLAAPRDIVGSAGAAWLLVGLALLATWRPHRVAELAALTLAPVVILGTAAALGQPFWVPRYLLIAIPPLVLLAAAAVAGRSPTAREGVARAVIVIVALGWAALPDQRALRETDSHNGGNYRRAAATVARGQQPGDVLLFQSHNRDMRPGIYYYLRADPGRPADFLLGRSAADVGDLWPVEVTDPVPRLRAQQRVWFFVYGRPPDPTAQRPDLAPVLRTEFRVVTIRRMSSSTLVLYERIRP
jgi:mannosyltransferase